MAVTATLAHVSAGMQVQSADGKVLGTITGMSSQGVETYLEVTPIHSLTAWLGLSHRAGCMYLPGGAVTAVAGTRVVLSMDALVARDYKLRPNWFTGPATSNLQFS